MNTSVEESVHTADEKESQYIVLTFTSTGRKATIMIQVNSRQIVGKISCHQKNKYLGRAHHTHPITYAGNVPWPNY